MITTSAAADNSPVMTLLRETLASMPEVSAYATPCTMKTTPRNVDRLRTLQSMLKISTPATISWRPFSSSFVQLLAIRSAASRESL
jgi:hypothetical protein